MVPSMKDSTSSSVSVPETLQVGAAVSWAVLVCGLLIWIAVQGPLVALPLWTRGSLPEPDDTYPYLVRTRQIEECVRQDCPALDDLRQQVLVPSTDPYVAQQRTLAASPFHIYHPLFSILLLFVKMFGLDFVTAYRVVWSLAPLFFGLAFSYFLIALFGVPVAGIALFLMAFKVYPDSGLHYVVPSSLTMGVALIVWARIISKRGDAPWTMTLGSLAMAAFHPIGLVYSLMAAAIAFLVSGRRLTKRMWWALFAVGCILTAGLIIPPLVRLPHLVLPPLWPSGGAGLVTILRGATEAVGIEVLPHIFKGEAALFGSFPWFYLAVAFGTVTLARERRGVVGSTFVVTGFFSVAMLLHVTSHPADLFFRLWIPPLTVLFGIAASGLWYTLKRSLELFRDMLRTRPNAGLTVSAAWPVVALAMFAGYACHMALSGLEQCYGIATYMRDRQPVAFDAKQPELMLSAARQGDRVLYTSPIVMSYYFACGAMQWGAVYYHPALRGTVTGTEWLSRPDIRFAVTYNPTIYHPSFEGLLDKDWRISRPDFIFTPLSKPRTAMPIAVDGAIRALSFRWIEVEPKGSTSASGLKLLISNPGKTSWIDLLVNDQDANSWFEPARRIAIRSGWSGWLPVCASNPLPPARYRIVLPAGEADFRIEWISFGDDGLRWPWTQKALVTFMPTDGSTGPICRSFDSSALLPTPLNQYRVIVLDDHGSTVLLRIDR